MNVHQVINGRDKNSKTLYKVFLILKNSSMNIKNSIVENGVVLNEGGFEYIKLSYRSKALEHKILFSYMVSSMAEFSSYTSKNDLRKPGDYNKNIGDIEFELNHIKIREENGFGTKKENDKRKKELLDELNRFREAEHIHEIWNQISKDNILLSDKLENERQATDAKRGIIITNARIKINETSLKKLTSKIEILQESLKNCKDLSTKSRIEEKVEKLRIESINRLINNNDFINENKLYKLELENNLYELNNRENNENYKELYKLHSCLEKINSQLQKMHEDSLAFFEQLLLSETSERIKSIIRNKIFSKKHNIYLIQQEVVGSESIRKLEDIFSDLDPEVKEIPECKSKTFIEICKEYYSKSIHLDNLKLDNLNKYLLNLKDVINNETDKLVIKEYGEQISYCEEQLNETINNKNELSAALKTLDC